MSDENVPKLRLKPKLAPETPAAAESAPAATPAPESPPAPAAATPPPATPRVSRLKPRMGAEPAATPAEPAAAAPAEASPSAPAPAAEPPADAAVPPRPKLAFKTRDPAMTTPAPAETVELTTELPAEAALHAGAAPAAAPNFPPPPGHGAAAPVAVSFPPPTAKFPPPAGAKRTAVSAEARAKAKAKPASGGKKSLLPILGVVAVVVLGGGYFAFRKLTAESPLPSRPVVAKPPPPAPVQQVIDKAKAEQAAPLNEVVAADQGSAPSDKPTPPASAAAEAPPAPEIQVPAPPPPPPQASAAFKSWVEDLKILGVRGGANPKVFIEHTAYSPGDVVNPTLGISFVGFNPKTRMLTFKDKAGATVELRN